MLLPVSLLAPPPADPTTPLQHPINEKLPRDAEPPGHPHDPSLTERRPNWPNCVRQRPRRLDTPTAPGTTHPSEPPTRRPRVRCKQHLPRSSGGSTRPGAPERNRLSAFEPTPRNVSPTNQCSVRRVTSSASPNCRRTTRSPKPSLLSRSTLTSAHEPRPRCWRERCTRPRSAARVTAPNTDGAD